MSGKLAVRGAALFLAATLGLAPAAQAEEPTLERLRALVEARGLSGFEGPVREAVIRYLPEGVPHQVDRAGNLVVRIGKGPYRVLFLAHLDELGFVVSGIDPDGRLRVEARGRFLPALFQGSPVVVDTPKGPVPGLVASGERPAKEVSELRLELGTGSEAETRALGVEPGQPVTPRKELLPAGERRWFGRSLDDRVGCAALLDALHAVAKEPPEDRTLLFAFTVQEEVGLKGSMALRGSVQADVAFAIDTFVVTDAPIGGRRFADAELGAGPVFRAMDDSYVAQPEERQRLVEAARRARVGLQFGVTSGHNDASVWAYTGARTLALGWPMRSAHSRVELVDRQDVLDLGKLVAELARTYRE